MPVGSSSGVGKFVPTTETNNTATSGNSQTGDFTDFLKTISKSPALITGYSKILKSAGYYKGKITSKYTPALQKAFTDAEEARLSISAVRPIGRDEFLQETISLGGAGSGGAGGTARTVTQTYVASDTDIESLINKLYQNLTGYKATSKQLAEAKKDLVRQEKMNPVKQSYDASGNLVQTGGINEEQYLTSKLQTTGAAEKTRAEIANEILLKELGGLR
jgi:hypothetical protein